MPVPGYNQRIASGAVARRPRQGAGTAEAIGAGLAGLGDTLDRVNQNNVQVNAQIEASEARIAQLEQDRTDEALSSQVAVAQAESAQRLRVFAAENQGRADFETRYSAEIDREIGATRDLIGGNVRVSQQFAGPIANFAATQKASAQIQGIEQRAKVQSESLKTQREIYGGQAYQNFQSILTSVPMIDALIDGNSGFADGVKPMAKREELGYLVKNGLRGLIDRGELDRFDAVVATPTFAESLSPDDLNSLIDQARAGRTALAFAAKAEMGQAKALLADQMAAVKLRVDAGEEVSSQELLAIANGIKSTGGDASQLTQLNIWNTQIATNRAIKGKSTVEVDAIIAEYDARDEAGALKPNEQIMLKQLKSRSGAGRDSIATNLRGEFAKGPQGEAAVAAQLGSLQPAERYEMAEKVEKGFGAYALLDGPVRELAIAGRADRVLLKGHSVKGRKEAVDYLKQTREFVGSALAGYQSTVLSDAAEIASSLYARRVRIDGLESFDRGKFRTALNMALGAKQVRRNDGGYEWAGGIGGWNGHKLQLPDGMTERVFGATVAAHDFATARDGAGNVVSKASALGALRPQYAGDSEDGSQSLYIWTDAAGNSLRGVKGGTFYLRIPNR